MGNSDDTKDKLLLAARETFWRRGYANVGLREVARLAGVDVALISRYFGGKQGLFEATLAGAFDLDAYVSKDVIGDALVSVITQVFSLPIDSEAPADPVMLLVENSADPDVGPAVRAAFEEQYIAPLRTRLGPHVTRAQVDLMTAVLLGAKFGRKSMNLPGLAGASDDEIFAQNLYLVRMALAYPDVK